MWTFENKNSRSFVDLLGHEYKTFEMPHVRAVLLRGIAWAGKRANVDEFCSKEELGSLRYPAGGPSTPAAEAQEALGSSRLYCFARRGGAADQQTDRNRLGPARPALGGGDAGISERPPRHA